MWCIIPDSTEECGFAEVYADRFFYAIKYNYDFYQFAKIRSPPLRFDFTNNQIGGRKNGF